MSKCIGCGVTLQTNNESMLGFTSNENNKLCKRCFEIRNYNKYKIVMKDNNDYINLLKKINSDDLVILVVDLLNINKNIEDISKLLHNDIILVLTKRDLLPKSCNEEKFINYFKNLKLNILDTVVISSKNNYNLDTLYDKIKYYKTSNKVYVVGFTNSGKSTLINKLIYNYSDNDTVITTSNLPSTTIDLIEVKIDDSLTLVDTPGLVNDEDIINHIDTKTLKKIIPKKEIKPKTYQIKSEQTILIDNLVRLDIKNKTDMTIYMSNELDIKRIYDNTSILKDLKHLGLDLDSNNDLVIQGLGFIKFNKKVKIIIYTNCLIYVRKSLIG